MIRCHMREIEGSRSPERTVAYEVTCEGLPLVAETRHPFTDACRALAAMGFYGDMELWDDRMPRMRGDIEKMAERVYMETDKDGIRNRKWQPYPAGLAQDRGSKGGALG